MNGAGRRARLVVVVVACAALAAVLAPAPGGAAAPRDDGPTSIVQLGDSIAAGEGTLYGYTYDHESRTWTGGNIDATWPGPNPLCHDSPDAYGNHVASYFGADFTQLACTGATFANGITAPEVSDGTTLGPAQFGDWATQTDLNPRYDAAAPDLVLITLGADDLQFVSVVESCIENSYEHYFDLADLECVAGNPGATITTDVFDALPTLGDDYDTLVTWIKERAQAHGAATPKIVFTTYPDPLPARGTKCPDTSYLYPQQVRYLSSLVQRLNRRITASIDGLDDPDVGLVDLSDVYDVQGVSHRWCSRDPWAYGLSIIKITEPSSFESQAPFHPTPAGQRAIADHVVAEVRKLFA